MKPVDRSELLDLGAYEHIRGHFRQRVIELKRLRRLAVGPHMSLVFENHDTVLLQIQEMLRTERISDERAIAHELETYNELIPGPGQLSATLFIEYEDAELRRSMLQRLASVRDRFQLWAGERKATARFAAHFGEELDRLPAVNYLTFDIGVEAGPILLSASQPAAIEVTHADYSHRVELPAEMRRELARDLEGVPPR